MKAYLMGLLFTYSADYGDRPQDETNESQPGGKLMNGSSFSDQL